MAVLTEQECPLVDKLLSHLEAVPKELEDTKKWLANMEQMEDVILNFPSMFQKPTFTEDGRQQTLLDSLLVNREGDKTLYLPARATLGKSFLIAKYHMFNQFIRVAKKCGMPEEDIQALKDLATTLIFTLMAEDVYLNLLDDLTTPEVVRRQVAMAVIIRWERRSDYIINENHKSALHAVWSARKNLVPVFGAMMGMSELALISFDLGDMWNKFINKKLSDPDIRLALEEFLMGLSFEQIHELRDILRERGMSAVNRDEIHALLHEKVNVSANIDLDDFYMVYTIRRDNARARKRLHHRGPHNTLEDYYMAFVFEQYRATDFHGVNFV
jgi:hypothetical protein